MIGRRARRPPKALLLASDRARRSADTIHAMPANGESGANAGGARRYDGQVVVVTGGGSGLGEAMCRAFAREGASVAVVDLRGQAASKVADECAGGARAYECDVADADAVRATFAAVAADLGPLDVLVNNAGIARRNQEVQERMLGELEAAMTGAERHSLGATTSMTD